MALEANPSMRVLGTVGMAVNGLFLSICLWRLFVTFSSLPSSSFTDSRALLHIFMSVFGLFEFLYLVSIFAEEKYSDWGYTLHMLALVCYIISFCLIFAKWEKTLGIETRKRKVGTLSTIIIAVNVLATIPVIVILYIGSSYSESSEKYWQALFTRAIVESCSLLFSTMWLFGYSVRLNDRLSRITEATDPTRSSDRETKTIVKSAPVRRVVMILFLCSLCYIARIFCLILLLVDFLNDGAGKTDRFNEVGWFILSNWVPTLIPGLMFLYTSRVVKINVMQKKTLQDLFKNDLDSEDETGVEVYSNPMGTNSTDYPSVNIDGLDRMSYEMRNSRPNRESVDSVSPEGHFIKNYEPKRDDSMSSERSSWFHDLG